MSGQSFDLTGVVARLRAASAPLEAASRDRRLPSRATLQEVVSDLQAVLFPRHFAREDVTSEGRDFFVGRTLDAALTLLREQILRGLLLVCEHGATPCVACDNHATEIVQAFAAQLPSIRTQLGTDVQAAWQGDPAATSPDETIICYPGVTSIIHHRLAHALYQLEVPLIPRMISEIGHSATGIDIHPGAEIGHSFFIDHGTGVVIGETCLIGDRVRLYQGVTLGAKSFPLDAQGKPIKGIPRHPIVEDDVIIYAEATILGRITIGAGSSIGGNVWLTHSVPPRSRITQAQVSSEVFDAGAGI